MSKGVQMTSAKDNVQHGSLVPALASSGDQAVEQQERGTDRTGQPDGMASAAPASRSEDMGSEGVIECVDAEVVPQATASQIEITQEQFEADTVTVKNAMSIWMDGEELSDAGRRMATDTMFQERLEPRLEACSQMLADILDACGDLRDSSDWKTAATSKEVKPEKPGRPGGKKPGPGSKA